MKKRILAEDKKVLKDEDKKNLPSCKGKEIIKQLTALYPSLPEAIKDKRTFEEAYSDHIVKGLMETL